MRSRTAEHQSQTESGHTTYFVFVEELHCQHFHYKVMLSTVILKAGNRDSFNASFTHSIIVGLGQITARRYLTVSPLIVISQADSQGTHGQSDFLLGHWEMHHHVTKKPAEEKSESERKRTQNQPKRAESLM